MRRADRDLARIRETLDAAEARLAAIEEALPAITAGIADVKAALAGTGDLGAKLNLLLRAVLPPSSGGQRADWGVPARRPPRPPT